jgi:phage protein D
VITINGTPVAGLFWEKLIRVTVHDHEGGKADQIDMQLEDGPPFLAIPRKDDEIMCWLGYEDGTFDFMGRFKVDDVESDCIPWTLSIKGKSADLRQSAKEHRSRHWDGKPLGDIIREQAAEHGLEAQVDDEIAAFIPENGWIGQNGESDLHFWHTRAERLGGVCSVKNGKVIIAKRGAGMTPGGTGLIPVIATPPMIIKGTCKVRWGQRERHKKVRAHHHNLGTGKREYEDEDTGDSSADASYTMRHAMSGKQEARRAARGRAKFLRAGGLRTSVTIEGNPLAKAGAPMSYAGVRPQVDGLQFVIETAVHSFSKTAGYRTELRARGKTDSPTGDE